MIKALSADESAETNQDAKKKGEKRIAVEKTSSNNLELQIEKKPDVYTNKEEENNQEQITTSEKINKDVFRIAEEDKHVVTNKPAQLSEEEKKEKCKKALQNFLPKELADVYLKQYEEKSDGKENNSVYQKMTGRGKRRAKERKVGIVITTEARLPENVLINF